MKFKYNILILFVLMISSCVSKKEKEVSPSIEVKNSNDYNELHRPKYHYTSKKNWFNDPNGLILIDGLYHMYYQYNPEGTQWGHMSWGHATSKDLVFWKEEKVAIPEDKHMIFSGTTAVNKHTKTELCDTSNCIVAAYTSFEYEIDSLKNIKAIVDILIKSMWVILYWILTQRSLEILKSFILKTLQNG